jgi:hypothetical protein
MNGSVFGAPSCIATATRESIYEFGPGHQCQVQVVLIVISCVDFP